jgi:TetR/AcrR family transcriptional regulator, cholesterol catabolism regulator
MEMRDRILEKATELFMRYGIRSVSMDDIATQLGISKKTIYQSFADKDELVDAIIDGDIRQMQHECVRCQLQSGNAIEEIFLTMDMIQGHLQNMNPMLLYDLQKFHFRSFQKFMAHKNSYLLDIIRQNLEKGIAEGLYRKNLNTEVLSRFRLESLMIPFNMDQFPPAKFNLVEVMRIILEHFLFGLASEKGYQMILKYQKEQFKTSAV